MRRNRILTSVFDSTVGREKKRGMRKLKTLVELRGELKKNNTGTSTEQEQLETTVEFRTCQLCREP